MEEGANIVCSAEMAKEILQVDSALLNPEVGKVEATVQRGRGPKMMSQEVSAIYSHFRKGDPKVTFLGAGK